MYQTLVRTIVLLSILLRQVIAQGTTTPIIPFSTCDVTTFPCDNGDGCCPINGCCGGGCCELGYACINEGTSDATCCPSFDLTKCGTVEPVSYIRKAIHSIRCSISHKNIGSNILDKPPDDSGSGSDSDSDGHVCTGIRNCNNAPGNNQGWTCFMGETCGWAYGVCDPCPYLGGGGDSDSGSPSPTTAPSPKSTIDSSDSDDDNESSDDSGGSSSDDGSGSDATTTAENSDPTSTSGASRAYLSKEDIPILRWLVTVVLGGIVAIAV